MVPSLHLQTGPSGFGKTHSVYKTEYIKLPQQQHQELFSFVDWKQIYTMANCSWKLIHVIKTLHLTTSKKKLSKPSSEGGLGWQDDPYHNGTALTSTFSSQAGAHSPHVHSSLTMRLGKRGAKHVPTWWQLLGCHQGLHPNVSLWAIQWWFPVNM